MPKQALSHTTTHPLKLIGLVDYLYRDGLIDSKTAQLVIHVTRQNNMPLTQYLVKSQLVSSVDILHCCKKNFALPVFDLKKFNPHCLNKAIIPLELIYHHRVLALMKTHATLRLGITDPTNHTAITAIGFHTGLHIRPMLVEEEALNTIIKTHCQPKLLNAQLKSALSNTTPVEEAVTQQDDAQSDEPIIKFVDQLLHDACSQHVSDIHIEPYEQHCRIRFRRDGILYEATSVPSHLSQRITTRLKILGNLNIAEKRLPQDGRIYLANNDKTDIRINTCPVMYGEKIVLRLLDTQYQHLDIHTLGLTQKQTQTFLSALHKPQGLILVTGPTGSGKTLTLYSALNYLNQIEKNISSVEDPIEIQLYGINQVNIHPKLNLDFANVLRALLRQDPDILMIGEIRDQKTAQIAIQAAQTGHLVLSTLHTNSAAETLSRLQAMQIDIPQLKETLSLIIAQRLVRKLCQYCKQMLTDHTYRATGCDQCHKGYHGRAGIFELLTTVETTTNTMSLRDAGMQKVQQGITSLAELNRILGEDMT